MNDIIKVKPDWEKIKKRHEGKLNELQVIIDKLTANGLTVNMESLTDLINFGSSLLNQVDKVVKSNSNVLKLPAAREKFIIENSEILRRLVSDAKTDLNRTLAADSVNPLSIDAYELKNGLICVSESWVESLKESYTIRSTEARQKALELIANVEKSVGELNEFVKDNKYFGTGISSSQDARRTLMYIRGDGSLVTDIDSLELI